MNDFLISVVSVIFLLGVMIVAHEWGHFIVARLCGVRVEVFSVGMGPRLWGVKRGPTDYRLSALPIGGYVRMAGENPAEERTGAPDEFLSKKRWQRALIILAGPTMNILLAFVIATGMFMSGRAQPAFYRQRPQVSLVMSGTPAAKAGLRSGDLIVSVNGKPVRTWDDAIWHAMFVPANARLHLVVDRAGQRIPLSVPTSADDALGDLLGYPVENVLVKSVMPGTPAAKDGIQGGDRIVSIDGNEAVSRFLLGQTVQDSAGKPVQIAIERQGKILSLTLHPVYGKLDGESMWYIGVRYQPPPSTRTNRFSSAVRGGVRYSVMLTAQIVDTVVKLVEHKDKLKQLSGPVGIAKASGQAAREGPFAFLSIMAVISLNLGILNLLPIPILDGWHLLTLGVEGTIRRDLSLAVKERAMQVGVVFLLLLILIVTYNDILKLVMPSH